MKVRPWMYSATFQRATMGLAAAIQVWVLALLHLPWTGHWSGYVPIVCLIWIAWAQLRIERTRREIAQWQAAHRWALAQHFPDPVGAMAGMDYLDRLSPRQREELREWFAHEANFEVHPDDLPPVVRDFHAVLSQPPRES